VEVVPAEAVLAEADPVVENPAAVDRVAGPPVAAVTDPGEARERRIWGGSGSGGGSRR
jgi:hypothetical protein